jgi:hypothetical protein
MVLIGFDAGFLLSLVSHLEEGNDLEAVWCDLHAVPILPAINFRMSKQIVMKPRTYIMAPESISTVYFMNPSH